MDINLTITEQEHELLIRLLKAAWNEMRTEVHHAHFSPEFREGMKREEGVLGELLEKARRARHSMPTAK
jgi:hypothetical protein